MLVFVVVSMLAVGSSLTVGQIVAPLRNRKLVFFALLANFVLMPAGALAIAKLLRLEQPLGIALILLGVAAGAPFLPKLAGIAKGNLAFAVGLMVLLMVLTVAYMPLVLPLLLEGVSVDPLKIARSLILLMLLPLGVGLALNARFGRIAERMRAPLNGISSLSLALLIVLLLVTNIQNVISLFGTRGILASILFLFAGAGVGWLLGGPGLGTKGVLALATAQRNIAAALVVGGKDFDDPRVLVMIVVVAVVGLLILMPLARFLGSRTAETPA
jgi:BASS family bile acid:Na+ symporter